MAISFGPKLGLLYNALIGESYFDSLRIFLQSIDALVQGSVINATQSAPPSSPNPGDAYLLTGGTPSGAWTGQAGNIAVWDAQLTNSGTNTVVPGWIFLSPKAGWIVWNVAAGNLIVFNGTSWNSFTSGANFPTNTDITSMTGIPGTTINSSGYEFDGGTAATTTIINASGFQYGSAPFSSGPTVQIANQVWTGIGYTGIGLGVTSGSAATIIGAGVVGTTSVTCIGLDCTGTAAIGVIQCNNIESFTPGQALSIIGQGVSGANSISVSIGGNNNLGQSLLAFGGTAGNYPTQTTVGAAGGASALPATPTVYIPVMATVAGVMTQVLIPAYTV